MTIIATVMLAGFFTPWFFLLLVPITLWYGVVLPALEEQWRKESA